MLPDEERMVGWTVPGCPPLSMAPEPGVIHIHNPGIIVPPSSSLDIPIFNIKKESPPQSAPWIGRKGTGK